MKNDQSAEDNPNDIQNEISWTPEEFEKLLNGGFIPPELFEPSRSKELEEYLRFNNDNLREHCYPNYDKFPFAACVPPQNEWPNAPDLRIIDRRTRQVIQVLEMGRDFELCEGVYLKIKAKELPEWERETAEAKKLNKEQSENLKTFLTECGKDQPLTRKEIVTFIEEIRKPKQKEKCRKSGHLVDQKLKYKKEPSLFDTLMPETKQIIEDSKFEVSAQGIKLNYSENKLINAFSVLLHEKSQKKDSNSDSFYSGNGAFEMVTYGSPNRQAIAPKLKFRPSELYKAFMGEEKYSGSDVKHIINTLRQLENKKFLINYDRVKTVKEGNKTKKLTDRIEAFQSLFVVVSFIPDLTEEEKATDASKNFARESRGEIIIVLNPIFRDQIDTKFIEFPTDTAKRLVIAAGGFNNVTASMDRLMEYMLREISASRYVSEINEVTLPHMLGLENYVKQNRKKLLRERIDKDIQAIINIGIILQAELVSNAIGGMKWVFHLNKDYE